MGGGQKVSIRRDGKWLEQLFTATTWTVGRVCGATPAAIAGQVASDVDQMVADFVSAYSAARGQ
jgi:hypothetical protein